MADRPASPSEKALKAAKALVAYIEFFRTHGTGETMARYPDDEAFGGYDNIVRRAHELAEQIEDFDMRRAHRVSERSASMTAPANSAVA